jgi:predicted phosphodiesterase
MSERSRELLETAAVGAAAVPFGMAFGAVEANTQFNKKVVYAPGMEANVSLSVHKGLAVNSDLADVKAPNYPVHTGVPGINGVKIDITKLQPPKDITLVQEYDILFGQFDSAVAKPTAEGVLTQTLEGITIGAVVAGVAAVTIWRRHRDNKRNIPQEQNEISSLREKAKSTGDASLSEIADAKQARIDKLHKRRKTRKFIAGALTALAISVGMSGESPGSEQDSVANVNSTPISALLESKVPELRGATVSGFFGKSLNQLPGVLASNAASDVDFWQQSAIDTNKVYENYLQGPGKKYAENTNIKTILQVSDIHCDTPYLENYFGSVLGETDPSLVLINGDTGSNADTMPYEARCYSDLDKDIGQARDITGQPMPAVNIEGNHDPFTAPDMPHITTLDSHNDYHVHGDWYDVVGDTDPVRTTLSNSPSNVSEQNRLLAQQGHNTAEAGCKIRQARANQFGPPPFIIAMGHESVSGYETIVRGCADIVETGHTHHEEPIQKFTGDNGQIVLQHTVGTASGADLGILPAEKPLQDATLALQYYNQARHKIVGQAVITVTPGGLSKVSLQKLPIAAPESDYDSMRQYLKDYAGAPSQ